MNNNEEKIVLQHGKKYESNYTVERYVDTVKKPDGSVERIFHIGRYMMRVSGDGKASKEKPVKIERSTLSIETFDHAAVGDKERDADIKRLTDEEFANFFGALSPAQQKEIEKMEKRNARDEKLAEKQLKDIKEKTRLGLLEEEERKLSLIRENYEGVEVSSLKEKDEKTIKKLSELTRIGLESEYTDPKLNSPVNKESLENLKGYHGKTNESELNTGEQHRIIIPKSFVPKKKEEDVEFDINQVKIIKSDLKDSDFKFTELQGKDITEIPGIDEKTRQAIELSRQVAAGNFQVESLNTINIDDIKAKPYNPDNDPLNAKDAARKKFDKKLAKEAKKMAKLESKKKLKSDANALPSNEEILLKYYDDENTLKKEQAKRQKQQKKEELLRKKLDAKELKGKISKERKNALLAEKEAERIEKDRLAAIEQEEKEAYYQSPEYLAAQNKKDELKEAKLVEKESKKQAKLAAKLAAKEEKEFRKLEKKSAAYEAAELRNEQKRLNELDRTSAKEEARIAREQEQAEKETAKEAMLEEKAAALDAKLQERNEKKLSKEQEKLDKKQALAEAKEEEKLQKLQKQQEDAAYMQSEEYLEELTRQESEKQALLDDKNAKLAMKAEAKAIKKQAKLEAKAAKKQSKLEDSVMGDSNVDEINADFNDNDQYDLKAAKMEAKAAKKRAKLEAKEAKKYAKMEAKAAKKAYLQSDEYLDNVEQQRREKEEALQEKAKLKEERRILAEEKKNLAEEIKQSKLDQKSERELEKLAEAKAVSSENSEKIVETASENQSEVVETREVDTKPALTLKEEKKLSRAEIKEAKKQAKLDEKMAKAALEAEIEAERVTLEAERIKREAIKEELIEKERQKLFEEENVIDSSEEIINETDDTDDLQKKSVGELKEIAKEFSIENYTKMKKAELIEAIENSANINRSDIDVNSISVDERNQKEANIRESNERIEKTGSRYKPTIIDKKIENVGVIETAHLEVIKGYSEEKKLRDHSDSYYRLVIRGIIEDEIVHANVYSNNTTGIINEYAKDVKKLVKYKSKFSYFVTYDGTIETHDHHFSCATAFIPKMFSKDEIKTILKKKVKKSSDVETIFITIYPITETKKRVIVIVPDNPKLYGTAKILHDELVKGNIKPVEDFVANYSDNYFLNNSGNISERNKYKKSK